MKTCFVISPIGDDGSDIRKNADHLFSYILKPVLNECGYDPLRADMVPVPGMINPHIIKHIIEADLAIADLTGMNPNVFYELAIRHVIGKPYIHLIREGESIPFDVKDIHTISYSMHIESVEKAKKKIREQVAYFDSGADVISPFTMTLDILESQRSETPKKLDDINKKMDKLDKLIGAIMVQPKDEGVDNVLDVVTEKLEHMEHELSRIPRKLEEKLSNLRNTSSSPDDSKNSEKKKQKDQEPAKQFIPKGLANRSTPNTYTMREWIDKFGAK